MRRSLVGSTPTLFRHTQRGTRMTTTAFASYLESLAAAARAASAAELEHQQDAARRAAELKAERAFAWRRLNLMRAIAAAVRGAEDAEAATAAGRGRDAARGRLERRHASRSATVADALRAGGAGRLGRHAASRRDAADPAAALAAFEAWYAADARRAVPGADGARDRGAAACRGLTPRRPLTFDAWIAEEFAATGGFTALVVLVGIGELSVTPLRSTWFHVIGDELDWPAVARLLRRRRRRLGRRALRAAHRPTPAGRCPTPRRGIALRDLGQAVIEDRTVLNAEHFFDRHGRRMQIEEVPAQ